MARNRVTGRQHSTVHHRRLRFEAGLLKEAAHGAEEALPPVAIWLMAWRVLGRVGCAGAGADTEAEALDRDADEEETLGADAEAAAGALPELGRRNWGGSAGADTEAEALDRDADEEATLGADVEAAAGALPELGRRNWGGGAAATAEIGIQQPLLYASVVSRTPRMPSANLAS